MSSRRWQAKMTDRLEEESRQRISFLNFQRQKARRKRLTGFSPSLRIPFSDAGDGVCNLSEIAKGIAATFARASTAYTVNALDELVQVASGAPRSYYTPQTAKLKQAHVQTDDLNGSRWSNYYTDAITSGYAGPEGLLNAWLWEFQASMTAYSPYVYQYGGGTGLRLKRDTLHTYSWEVKWLSGPEWCFLEFVNNREEWLGSTVVWFDLVNCVKGVQNYDGDPSWSALVDYGIEDLGDGWRRVYLTIDSQHPLASTQYMTGIYGSIYSCHGDGLRGTTEAGSFLLADPMMYEGSGSTAVDFVPNPGLKPVMSAETSVYEGYYREPASTNLCDSDDLSPGNGWTAIRGSMAAVTPTLAGLYPDGSTIIYGFKDDATAANNHLVAHDNDITIVNGQTYTFSVYVQIFDYYAFCAIQGDAGNSFLGAPTIFDMGTLEVTKLGANVTSAGAERGPHGTARLWATAVATGVTARPSVWGAGSPTDTVYDGANGWQFAAWGPQLELAAKPTSYIPVSVGTRPKDSLTYPTAGWLNTAEGTFFFNDKTPLYSGQVWLALNNVTGNYTAGASLLMRRNISGLEVGGNGSGNSVGFTEGDSNTMAGTYKLAGTIQRAAGNGAAGADDATLDFTGVGTAMLRIGELDVSANQPASGRIKNLRYYSKLYDVAKLIANT